MKNCPSTSLTLRSFFFVLIAGSKTVTNIGQACLTVDTTVMTIYCLSQQNSSNSTNHFPDNVVHFSDVSQIIAATFSTLMIMLTRYPSIWNKLTLQKTSSCCQKQNDPNNNKKVLLFVIGFFGALSCLTRGLAAYLSVEILLGERWNAEETTIKALGVLSAMSATLSCLCFNFTNMMSRAIDYYKEPTPQLQRRHMIPIIATVSQAVAIRFFVFHFLVRRQASNPINITGQIILTLAELILGWFTMVAPFDENWKENAKRHLCTSPLLTGLILGDGLTTWLGYYTITWYSILTWKHSADPLPSDNGARLCPSHEKEMHAAAHWVILSAACFISIPATLSYFHYLLQYAVSTYRNMVSIFSTDNEERRPLIINNA